jgi:hypothetical protein
MNYLTAIGKKFTARKVLRQFNGSSTHLLMHMYICLLYPEESEILFKLQKNLAYDQGTRSKSTEIRIYRILTATRK